MSTEKQIEHLAAIDKFDLGHILLAAKGHKVKYSDGLRTGETNVWYPTFNGMDHSAWRPAVSCDKGRDQAMSLIEENDLYISNNGETGGAKRWFVSAPPHINNIVEHSSLQFAVVAACVISELGKPPA